MTQSLHNNARSQHCVCAVRGITTFRLRVWQVKPAESEQRGLVKMLMTPAERKLGVGQHFGEVGVILPQTPCIATCTAVSKCSTLVLMSDDFMELFGRNRKLIAEMTIRLLRSRCTLQSVLNYPAARAIFEVHIEKEYAQESMHFFDAAEDYLNRLPGEYMWCFARSGAVQLF